MLEPRSRRPRSSPTAVDERVVREAVNVRSALEQSGLDFGPISVHDRMKRLGIDPVPSVASLARIFRREGVARYEPLKRPRASYRRFVYPEPNGCWQLDATEYVLSGGRTCTIFQLIDDNTRVAVASQAASGETAEGAVAVMRKGIAARGVPQRLLSDNGSALNPSRRGVIGQLVAYVVPLGVEPITGKPYKPTTQGKNERFHQTLFRYLDKQPLADSLEQLQEQIDEFDRIYNTERPHQALEGRITPQQAWDSRAKAAPPRPREMPPIPIRSITIRAGQPGIVPTPGTRERRVQPNGSVEVHNINFHISGRLRGQTVLLAETLDGVTFTDLDGTVLLEQPWPTPGTTYVSNGRPRGGRHPKTSPMS